MKTLLALISFSLLAACSSKGFHQESMMAEMNQDIQVTDQEIAAELRLKPQLPAKFRVAVYFTEGFAGNVSDERLGRWRPEEKERILALKIPGATLYPLFIEGRFPSEKELRKAAARQGADALLKVQMGQETFWDANGLATTYLLVLPAFFVHGTDVNALVATRARLTDVKNDYLYLAAEAEGEGVRGRPLTSPNEKEILLETRRGVIEKLAAEIEKLAAEIEKRFSSEVASTPKKPS